MSNFDMDKLIARINELARKQKSPEGLSELEKSEQQSLRAEYIAIFKSNFKQQLKSIKVVDKHGKDVTPAKLKKLKEEN